MKHENKTAPPAPLGQVERGVRRHPLEPKRPGFLAQIEACRREVAQWPDWMKREHSVPAWMANHATDL